MHTLHIQPKSIFHWSRKPQNKTTPNTPPPLETIHPHPTHQTTHGRHQSIMIDEYLHYFNTQERNRAREETPLTLKSSFFSLCPIKPFRVFFK